MLNYQKVSNCERGPWKQLPQGPVNVLAQKVLAADRRLTSLIALYTLLPLW